MLQIKNLNLTHKKDLRPILEDFNFVLNKGDRAVIIGEEGNGKSTLLKWIFEPELVDGYAEAEGECICTGERLGYLPQELPEEDYGKSLYEFFTEEERFWQREPKQLSLLTRNLQLPADFFYGEQRMGTLSGGEKIKAQMARLLMSEPTILLLDEPSNDIDIDTLEWLEQLIPDEPTRNFSPLSNPVIRDVLAAYGGAIISISHDRKYIQEVCQTIYEMTEKGMTKIR